MKLKDVTTYHIDNKYMGILLGGYKIDEKANQLVAWFIGPIDFYIEEVGDMLKVGKSKDDYLLFVKFGVGYYG